MATEQNVMAAIRTSRPSFRSPQEDKVGYAIHASFLAAGYVLIASLRRRCPLFSFRRWDQFEDNYAFLYLNPQKGSKKVLVNCLLMVDALSDRDSEPLHLEINVGDNVTENGGSNYSSQFKNLGDLVARVDKEILSKLSGPSTTRPSSSEVRGSIADTNEQTVEVTEPQGSQPYHPYRVVVPPVYPTTGDTDRFPGAGGGTCPGRLYQPFRGDFGSGGGMLAGPDHPLFDDRLGGQQPGFPGAPPPVHPPGARFDPFGPPDVPGFEPNRFERDPRRPGGGTHTQISSILVWG